jgi:hypothetical protein
MEYGPARRKCSLGRKRRRDAPCRQLKIFFAGSADGRLARSENGKTSFPKPRTTPSLAMSLFISPWKSAFDLSTESLFTP